MEKGKEERRKLEELKKRLRELGVFSEIEIEEIMERVSTNEELVEEFLRLSDVELLDSIIPPPTIPWRKEDLGLVSTPGEMAARAVDELTKELEALRERIERLEKEVAFLRRRFPRVIIR